MERGMEQRSHQDHKLVALWKYTLVSIGIKLIGHKNSDHLKTLKWKMINIEIWYSDLGQN